MSETKNLYFSIAVEALPRLLSLLDRNPLSPTYGCFDRSFWLHRKTDFPTSTAQLSIKTLALCYCHKFPGNSLYGLPQVKAWLVAAIDYTLSIQHRDGSFDEWYPNERGWAGPTGYVAHALMEVRNLVAGELPAELVSRLDQCLARAARHLACRDEGDVLANHHAIALLPLTEIAELLDSNELRQASREWLEVFKAHACTEGWSLEYDGCDIGYNLGTLDFFADLHRLTNDPYLLAYARDALKFLSHFAFPDGSWAGGLGSRHTSHSYPFALEYWASLLPEGRALLGHARRSLKEGKSVRPMQQEDHFLHYRLADYIKAGLIAGEDSLGGELLPYEKTGFASATFPQAGFHLERMDDHLLWVAMKRGGAFRLIRLSDGKTISINNGCLVKSPGGAFTSLWQGGEGGLEGGVSVRAALHPLFTKRFSPLTFVMFRVACLAMVFPLPAFWFKRWVRARMITPKKVARSGWDRKIEWDEKGVRVRDRMRWEEPERWSQIFWGGEFSSRYVPQSHYFQAAEVFHPPLVFSAGENPGEVEFDWQYDFAGERENLRVKLESEWVEHRPTSPTL